uniref:Plexin_cytopl domain-containing protein n=1 Tax=Macrostomum lignano TaxID=282301 RepID=A0A1I8F6N3_9PLAT
GRRRADAHDFAAATRSRSRATDVRHKCLSDYSMRGDSAVVARADSGRRPLRHGRKTHLAAAERSRTLVGGGLAPRGKFKGIPPRHYHFAQPLQWKNLTDNITTCLARPVPSPRTGALCIKYLFDQLDDIARDTEFTRDAAHIWKSNAVINMLSGHHVAPTLPAPHLHQRRIQHHMMQQQQQQQPFQPHTPLTYQQMQLGPFSPHNG